MKIPAYLQTTLGTIIILHPEYGTKEGSTGMYL